MSIDCTSLLRDGRELRQLDGHRELTCGEIALSASHKNIYKKIIDDNNMFAMVFEDDVALVPGFVKKVDSIMRQCNRKKYDVIKLEYCNNTICQDTDPVLQEDDGGACTACYIVSFNGAKKLLDANTPIWMNSDGIMDNNHLKNIGKQELIKFHTEPPLAYQKQGFQSGSHR